MSTLGETKQALDAHLALLNLPYRINFEGVPWQQPTTENLMISTHRLFIDNEPLTLGDYKTLFRGLYQINIYVPMGSLLYDTALDLADTIYTHYNNGYIGDNNQIQIETIETAEALIEDQALTTLILSIRYTTIL